MRVTSRFIEMPGHRAGLFVLSDHFIVLSGPLFGIFARPTTAASLAACCHLAIVFRAVPERRCTSTLASEGNGCGCWLLLFEQIVGQRQRSGQQFPASRRPVLGQFGSCGEDSISLGDEVFEGAEFGLIRWHDLTIGPAKMKSKR